MSWVSASFHRMGQFETWETLAKLAPLFTACVAVGAAYIALRAIHAQRDIARKRAAIDFFLKTEMDNGMVEMYDHFREQEKFLQGLDMSAAAMFREENKKAYDKVRTWLNTLELISIGVHRQAFEEDVCFHYWRNVLTKGFKTSRTLIKYAREIPGGVDGEETYIELERLANSWEERARREKNSPRPWYFLSR